MQAIATTVTDPPIAVLQPVMVTSARGGPTPQIVKAPPKGPVQKNNDKGEGVKSPDKGKKNVTKTSASAATSASPSVNLRSKLQDKRKHTAVLIQEITEELQAIEEESLNDEHEAEVTQESDFEQEDSNNYLTKDDQ